MTKTTITNYRSEETIRLRQIRESTGLTQEEFAARVNMSLSAYKKAERGENQISVNLLKALNREFQVSSDFILFGEKRNFETAWMDIQSCTKKDKLCLMMRLICCFSEVNAYKEYIPDDMLQLDDTLYELLGEIIVKSSL